MNRTFKALFVSILFSVPVVFADDDVAVKGETKTVDWFFHHRDAMQKIIKEQYDTS